jgi:N-acetylglutamate synthase-like GNAT family acetyltransferase
MQSSNASDLSQPPRADIMIVPFEPRFAAGVVDVVVPIQRDEFGIPIALEAQPDLLDTRGYYQHGAGNFWVALAQDQVVGTIGLLDIGERRGALRKMFVKAAYRGAQWSVAQRLLDTLLASCRTGGITEVYLGTTEKFRAAHRFYEKNGFRLVERAALPAAFPLMVVDTRFYCRAP